MRMKRLISIMLTIIMLFGVIGPANVYAVEDSSSDTYGELLAEGLTEGSYVDSTAQDSEQYEYTVVGSDGSIATVSTDSMENLESVYVKRTGTSLPESGKYLIVSAQRTSNYAMGNTRTIYNNSVSHQNSGNLCLEAIGITDNKATNVAEKYVWNFVKTDNTYTIESLGENPENYDKTADSFETAKSIAPGAFLTVATNNIGCGLQFAETSVNWSIEYAGNASGSVADSWALSNNGGYLNVYRDGANDSSRGVGTWTAGTSDAGSRFFLFVEQYTVSSEKIAELTADVQDGSSYTETTWNAYQAALASAQEVYETTDAANAAYEALKEAVTNLAEQPWNGKVNVVYTRVTPDFTDTTNGPVAAGTYVIVGSHTGYSANKAVNNDGTFGFIDVAAYMENSGAELTKEDSSYEWKIAHVSGNTYYVSPINQQDQYAHIVNSTAADGVSLTTTATALQIVEPDAGTLYTPLAVCIGDGSGWFNYRDGHVGAWTGKGNGSSYYLYQKQYKVLKDVITEDVLEEASYTPDSWTAYQAVYNATNDVYTSLDEAAAAITALEEAIAGLEEANTSGDLTLPDGKFPLEDLYEAICQANGGQFLYSEEVYTYESGHAYREALMKARGTFTSDEEAMAALAELEAAVRGLETVADSCFPEIEWNVTNDANRTTGDTTQPNYVSNLTYLNTADVTLGEITFDEWEALTWEWSAISRLVNDEDERVSPVWSQASNGMWSRQFSNNAASSWEAANVYKISGTFVWPEGYDLNSTTVVLDSKNDFFYRDIYEYIDEQGLSEYFPLGQVLPVNDDVYVVMWAGDDKPTLPTTDDDGINNHLVFWSGTSGKGYWTEKDNTNNDWNRQEPATYLEWNLQGERAFRNSYPNIIGTGETKADGSAYSNSDVEYLTAEEQNYLSHTDGWYTLTDTTAINSVLRSNYPNGIEPGTEVHIDLYVMNNSGQGMIDELEIELFKEKDTDTNVIINYYLNEVSDDGYLGTEHLLNQAYGTSVTLFQGTGAGQLNSYKAEAIYQAGYKDVTDGVQLNAPLIVTEGGENVINVLYTLEGNKTVILTAPSATYAYDGTSKSLTYVDLEEVNPHGVVNGIENGTCTLPDGNTIENVFSHVAGIAPGRYENNFTVDGVSPIISVKDNGNDVTNSYTIQKRPGTLTITTNTVDEVYVYDFGVANTYTGVLKNDQDANVAEDLAATVTANSNNVTVDKNANTITYTPSSINTGETVTLTLEYAGGYTVEKTIQFVPANNVLYEESFVTAGDGWTTDGTAQSYVVDDNEDTDYGYTLAYEGDDVYGLEALAYSNGAALKAELTLANGASTVESEGKASFTFTGTGFDLISTCGEDTGLVLAVLKQDGKAVKSYFVDTYFAGDVANEEEGEEAIASGAAYQIPVIRDTELAYGTYTVDVYGYLVNTAGAGAAAASMFMMDDMMPVQQMAVSKEEILMAALQDLELEDVVDMATVDISYMDENSVLNGGNGGVEIASNVAMFALTDEVAAVDDAPTSFTGYVAVDAFRVYQPLEAEPEAYVENGVKFASVYDFVQTSINDLEEWTDDVAVYLEYEGNSAASSIADYKNQGPQNEVYLAPGCAIAFAVVGYEEGDILQVSAKAVTKGATPDFAGYDLTGTEMYYNIADYVYDASELGEGVSYVVIRNEASEGIMAISELKMSSHISVLASAELGEKVESELNVSNSAFKPETLTATLPSAAKKNRNFVLKFSGSTDIAELYFAKDETSEGTLVKATNTKAVASGKADLYTYSQTVKETAAGDYTYYVYAVNAEGVASERIPVTVTVQ